jgi:glutaredoxin 2
MQLLQKMLEQSARTTQAWKRFSSARGDKSYFADICDRDRGSFLAFESLKNSFQVLEDLQQDLMSLDRLCKESRAIVSHSLNKYFVI